MIFGRAAYSVLPGACHAPSWDDSQPHNFQSAVIRGAYTLEQPLVRAQRVHSLARRIYRPFFGLGAPRASETQARMANDLLIRQPSVWQRESHKLIGEASGK